jgi:hypothetical protein
MRHVPDPDRSEWVARMRERARLDAEELVPRPPFEVFGLAAPRLEPAALAETERVNGAWASIALVYGDWAEPDGPWVIVTTVAGETGARDRGAEAGLLRAIDHERNRIASQAGVDEDEPEGPPDYSGTDLAVSGETVRGLAARHGNVWAARVLAGGLTVTLAGRGVDPAAIQLSPVADLAPFLRARGEMLGQLAERHRRQPPPVLAPAEGLAAYHALAEVALGSQAQLAETLRAGRLPRYRADAGPTYRALWQRAVREQARLSGTDERQADEIVTRVINHVTHLQEQAPWFTARARLREAAIDETLRYSVMGEDVPSSPAQQAWARYWARHMTFQEPDAVPQADREAGDPLLSAWREGWASWAAGR